MNEINGDYEMDRLPSLPPYLTIDRCDRIADVLSSLWIWLPIGLMVVCRLN